MLPIRYLSETASHLTRVRIYLEPKSLSSLNERSRVGVDVELIQENRSKKEQRSAVEKVFGDVLTNNSFVDRRKDGERGSVEDHSLEFGVVGQTHC